jgi:hypothetical protein
VREVEELAGEPKALDSCYLEVFVKRGSRGLPLPSARSVGRDERDAALLLRSVLLDAGVDVCCRTYHVRERKGGEREGVSGAKGGGGSDARTFAAPPSMVGKAPRTIRRNRSRVALRVRRLEPIIIVRRYVAEE